MNTDRKKYFDKLGDVIESIETQSSVEDLEHLAKSGLEILDHIVGILKDSEEYEHGLQKAPDVKLILERLRDDYNISKEDARILKVKYQEFRLLSRN